MKRLMNKFKILPSTKAFMREALKTHGFSLFDFVHGYIYARWAYLYIGIGTGEHRLVKHFRPLLTLLLRFLSGHPADRPVVTISGIRPDRHSRSNNSKGFSFADTYHGKVVTKKAAQKLIALNKEIRLTDLEHIIPYAKARDLVLKHPDHILLLQCPCRASRPHPCLPLEVCLIIAEPFASLAHDYHRTKSRWISPAEALEVIKAEEKRGHIHHVFFKDAMLNRFFAICNCCACCCGAMQAMRNGIPMLAASGYVSRVDPEMCSGCGLCVKLCQWQALSIKDEIAQIDVSKCMGCGVCVSNCPQQARSLIRHPNQSEPLEIDWLVSKDNFKSVEPSTARDG